MPDKELAEQKKALQEKEQRLLKAKVENHIRKYNELVKETGIDFKAVVMYNPETGQPYAKIVFVETPEEPAEIPEDAAPADSVNPDA